MPVNRKGGGVNTLDDDDYGLGELGRIGESYDNQPAAYRALRLRARNAHVGINALDSLPEDMLNANPKLKGIRSKLVNTIEGVEPRIRNMNAARNERLNQQAVNAIGRSYAEGSINSQVSQMVNGQSVQAAGFGMTGQSWSDLEDQRSSILGRMAALRQSSTLAAGNYIGGHGVNASAANILQGNAGSMRDLTSQLAPIVAAMSQLKSQGLDPTGRQRNLMSWEGRANDLLDNNRLANEMASGKGLGSLSGSELKKKEAEAAERLIKALDELRNSAGKSAETIEDLNKNAEEARQEFEDMSKAVGMGGGNRGSATAQTVFSTIGQIANLVGNTVQTMAISQPQQVMQNGTGYAGLENYKYDTYRSAVDGNMTARLNMGGWANAKEFGESLATRQGIVGGLRVVGGAAGTVAGGLQTFDAVKGLGGSVMGNQAQNVASGVLATGEGIATTAIAGKDLVQKISTSATEIQTNHLGLQNSEALNHVLGSQLQGFRDQMMNGYRAGMGMGDRGSDFLDTVTNEGYMTRMHNVGMGIGEFGNLSQMGVQNMGSTFDANTAVRAKHLSNLGYGSAQENIGRMSGFAAAGMQNPTQSLERALEHAVGAGLSNSKTLNIIADNTGQMAETNNKSGGMFDVSEAINRLVLGNVDKSKANQEFATQRAFETFRSDQDTRMNVSASLAGQIGIARLQTSLGLDWNSAMSLQQTDDARIATWEAQAKQGGDLSSMMLDMQNAGINTNGSKMLNNDPAGFFSTLRNKKGITTAERGGAGWATKGAAGYQRLLEWIQGDAAGSNERFDIATGKSPIPNGSPKWISEAIMAMTQSIRNHDGTADTVAKRVSNFNFGLGRDFGNATAFGAEGTTAGGSMGDATAEANRGNKQGVRAAIAGGRAIGGVAGVRQSGDSADNVPRSEEGWATAAAESARTFGASAIRLDSASGKLERAADALIKHAGMSKIDPGGEKELEETKRKMNAAGEQGGGEKKPQ